MKTKVLSFVIATFMLGGVARADWLESQEGPVPVCVLFSFNGTPGVSEQHSITVPTALTFPANLGPAKGFTSGCKFQTAATASTAFLLQDNGSTVATLTVASSGTTCTFSTQAAFTVAQGHRLSIAAPATPDATLATGGISVCATR